MQLGRFKNRTPARFEYMLTHVSDPIVEVNAVVRHFRQPWVLIRKTELSYAQNKNRDKKMRLLGMDTNRMNCSLKSAKIVKFEVSPRQKNENHV
jgi:hypothetical protein